MVSHFLVTMIITDDRAVSLFFPRSCFSMASCTVILSRGHSAQILSLSLSNAYSTTCSHIQHETPWLWWTTARFTNIRTSRTWLKLGNTLSHCRSHELMSVLQRNALWILAAIFAQSQPDRTCFLSNEVSPSPEWCLYSNDHDGARWWGDLHYIAQSFVHHYSQGCLWLVCALWLCVMSI